MEYLLSLPFIDINHFSMHGTKLKQPFCTLITLYPFYFSLMLLFMQAPSFFTLMSYESIMSLRVLGFIQSLFFYDIPMWINDCIFIATILFASTDTYQLFWMIPRLGGEIALDLMRIPYYWEFKYHLIFAAIRTFLRYIILIQQPDADKLVYLYLFFKCFTDLFGSQLLLDKPMEFFNHYYKELNPQKEKKGGKEQKISCVVDFYDKEGESRSQLDMGESTESRLLSDLVLKDGNVLDVIGKDSNVSFFVCDITGIDKTTYARFHKYKLFQVEEFNTEQEEANFVIVARITEDNGKEYTQVYEPQNATVYYDPCYPELHNAQVMFREFLYHYYQPKNLPLWLMKDQIRVTAGFFYPFLSKERGLTMEFGAENTPKGVESHPGSIVIVEDDTFPMYISRQIEKQTSTNVGLTTLWARIDKEKLKKAPSHRFLAWKCVFKTCTVFLICSRLHLDTMDENTDDTEKTNVKVLDEKDVSFDSEDSVNNLLGASYVCFVVAKT